MHGKNSDLTRTDGLVDGNKDECSVRTVGSDAVDGGNTKPDITDDFIVFASNAKDKAKELLSGLGGRVSGFFKRRKKPQDVEDFDAVFDAVEVFVNKAASPEKLVASIEGNHDGESRNISAACKEESSGFDKLSTQENSEDNPDEVRPSVGVVENQDNRAIVAEHNKDSVDASECDSANCFESINLSAGETKLDGNDVSNNGFESDHPISHVEDGLNIASDVNAKENASDVENGGGLIGVLSGFVNLVDGGRDKLSGFFGKTNDKASKAKASEIDGAHRIKCNIEDSNVEVRVYEFQHCRARPPRVQIVFNDGDDHGLYVYEEKPEKSKPKAKKPEAKKPKATIAKINDGDDRGLEVCEEKPEESRPKAKKPKAKKPKATIAKNDGLQKKSLSSAEEASSAPIKRGSDINTLSIQKTPEDGHDELMLPADVVQVQGDQSVVDHNHGGVDAFGHDCAGDSVSADLDKNASVLDRFKDKFKNKLLGVASKAIGALTRGQEEDGESERTVQGPLVSVEPSESNKLEAVEGKKGKAFGFFKDFVDTAKQVYVKKAKDFGVIDTEKFTVELSYFICSQSDFENFIVQNSCEFHEGECVFEFNNVVKKDEIPAYYESRKHKVITANKKVRFKPKEASFEVTSPFSKSEHIDDLSSSSWKDMNKLVCKHAQTILNGNRDTKVSVQVNNVYYDNSSKQHCVIEDDAQNPFEKLRWACYPMRGDKDSIICILYSYSVCISFSFSCRLTGKHISDKFTFERLFSNQYKGFVNLKAKQSLPGLPDPVTFYDEWEDCCDHYVVSTNSTTKTIMYVLPWYRACHKVTLEKVVHDALRLELFCKEEEKLSGLDQSELVGKIEVPDDELDAELGVVVQHGSNISETADSICGKIGAFDKKGNPGASASDGVICEVNPVQAYCNTTGSAKASNQDDQKTVALDNVMEPSNGGGVQEADLDKFVEESLVAAVASLDPDFKLVIMGEKGRKNYSLIPVAAGPTSQLNSSSRDSDVLGERSHLDDKVGVGVPVDNDNEEKISVCGMEDVIAGSDGNVNLIADSVAPDSVAPDSDPNKATCMVNQVQVNCNAKNSSEVICKSDQENGVLDNVVETPKDCDAKARELVNEIPAAKVGELGSYAVVGRGNDQEGDSCNQSEEEFARDCLSGVGGNSVFVFSQKVSLVSCAGDLQDSEVNNSEVNSSEISLCLSDNSGLKATYYLESSKEDDLENSKEDRAMYSVAPDDCEFSKGLDVVRSLGTGEEEKSLIPNDYGNMFYKHIGKGRWRGIDNQHSKMDSDGLTYSDDPSPDPVTGAGEDNQHSNMDDYSGLTSPDDPSPNHTTGTGEENHIVYKHIGKGRWREIDNQHSKMDYSGLASSDDLSPDPSGLTSPDDPSPNHTTGTGEENHIESNVSPPSTKMRKITFYQYLLQNKYTTVLASLIVVSFGVVADALEFFFIKPKMQKYIAIAVAPILILMIVGSIVGIMYYRAAGENVSKNGRSA